MSKRAAPCEAALVEICKFKTLSIEDHVSALVHGEVTPFLLNVLVADHDGGGQVLLDGDFHVLGVVIADTQLLKIEDRALDDATIFLFDGAGFLLKVFQADERLLQETGGVSVVHLDFLTVVANLELQ